MLTQECKVHTDKLNYIFLRIRQNIKVFSGQNSTVRTQNGIQLCRQFNALSGANQ